MFRLGTLRDNAFGSTSDHGTLRLDMIRPDASALLSVSDDGTDDGTDDCTGSLTTGIDRPVVRLPVTALGSTVVAESAGHGLGSRSVVTLPLADSCEPPSTRLGSNG